MDIDGLSKALKGDLRLELKVEDYIASLNALVNETDKVRNAEDVEEIIIRSIKDHSTSRAHFLMMFKQKPDRFLDLLGDLSSRAISAIVDSFKSVDDTIPLMLEIKRRIRAKKCRSDGLLKLVYQLLERYVYKFEDIVFLAEELPFHLESTDIRPLVLLIFAQLDNKYKRTFNEKLLDVFDTLTIEADADHTESMNAILNTLSELYPVLTNICSEAFLSEELQTVLKRKILRNDSLIKKGLQLLSVACIDESVRKYIAEQYFPIIEASLSNNELKLHSALVLVKTWSFSKLKNTKVKQLGNIFIQNVESNDEREQEIAVEGLAYLSLISSVRNGIRSNGNVCLELVQLVVDEKTESCIIYGILSLLANLSTFSDECTPEQSSINSLKAYAELKNPVVETQTGKEEEEDIFAFIDDYIVDLQVIGSLSNRLKDLMPSCRDQFVKLIYNATRKRHFISECVKQGATKALLGYLGNMPIQIQFRLYAIRALNSILINTNPKLLFNHYSPLSTVPYLFELIPGRDGNDNEELLNALTTRDSYEALLALTNLAATDSADSLSKLIVSDPQCWSKIMNCILDETVQIQRSVLELLSNLMAYPLHIAAKFLILAILQVLRILTYWLNYCALEISNLKELLLRFSPT
ncbi:She4p Ecym_1329 [Eremothecium cymbalariae DBVPG|uniref:UNC-45/Cro1/She4 central domain-containing protein n=1 Tax=Eremothecium cymbalariae (strain CBS 270.75 / DBVPG 7215 / KCTC 17166 / NRRL Y-17582) TaxID=931890 RepID=G8JNA0_ERECY|nr:hypothetical protein Ecym_1329 [Eremothecium cymbalariae DBVPG\